MCCRQLLRDYAKHVANAPPFVILSSRALWIPHPINSCSFTLQVFTWQAGRRGTRGDGDGGWFAFTSKSTLYACGVSALSHRRRAQRMLFVNLIRTTRRSSKYFAENAGLLHRKFHASLPFSLVSTHVTREMNTAHVCWYTTWSGQRLLDSYMVSVSWSVQTRPSPNVFVLPVSLVYLPLSIPSVDPTTGKAFFM